MAKKKPDIRMVSYGVYTPFDAAGTDLPRVVDFTTRIPARVGIEFGYILRIRKARGEKLHFTIEHPPFVEDSGQVAPPFTGEVYVRTSDYQFFLGDSVWEPVDDKMGTWVLTTRLRDEEIARKAFEIVPEDPPPGEGDR
jgi:Domain of unknown function (DUF3859)